MTDEWTAAEIRGLVGRRTFSRLRLEYYEFKPYSIERLYEITEQRIEQAYGKLTINEEAILRLCEFIANEYDSNVQYCSSYF